jgi:hypothetical protein
MKHYGIQTIYTIAKRFYQELSASVTGRMRMAIKKNAQSTQRKDPLYKNSATPCVDLQYERSTTCFFYFLKNAQNSQRKDPLYKNSVAPCVDLYSISTGWYS